MGASRVDNRPRARLSWGYFGVSWLSMSAGTTYRNGDCRAMPDLILEVGTEDMPANAVAQALDQLKGSVEQGLRALRLETREVTTCGTMRRLIVCAADVPERQPDQEREVRGPSKAVAFGADGKPTGAAQGFARKQGVPVESLQIVDTPQGEYVQARVRDEGRPAVDVLGNMLQQAVRALTFPKMMRWGEGSIRFVRPLRWMVALLGTEVVPFEIVGVASGRKTRGHRFLAPAEVELTSSADLLPTLANASVMVDPEQRRRTIREQADALAAEVGGIVPWDEDLLDENTWLVEWPTVLLGHFDPDFLRLPKAVLVTAMKKHQRFFPVLDANGALMPCFISVRNGSTEHLDVVRHGNERVLTSRFADARYFAEQDSKAKLSEFAERLGRLLFQEKLGTVAEKRSRLVSLAGSIADTRGASPEECVLARRAADLAKADLVTSMVVELPSLQGVVGREYALRDGEDPRVADAIAEHYLPRFAGDALPQSCIGSLVAVADRIDTLVGYVGLGILPTGSSDPYGLRRAAHGVSQILAGDPDMPSLLELELSAARAYEDVNKLSFPRDQVCNDLQTIFDQRLEAILADRGVRYDVAQAALSGGFVYSTLVYGVVKRAEALQALAETEAFVPTVQAAARVANILRSASVEPAAWMPGKEGIHGAEGRSVERAVSVLETQARRVNTSLFQEASEHSLFDAAYSLIPEVARHAAGYEYEQLYGVLISLDAPVNAFFDDVLVMCEDEGVKKNRLQLLELVDVLYKSLADFTRIVCA